MREGLSAEQAREIVLSVCRERSLRPDLFFSIQRQKYLDEARREAVLRLYDLGYTRKDITVAARRSNKWITARLLEAGRMTPDAVTHRRSVLVPIEVRQVMAEIAQSRGLTTSMVLSTKREPRFVEARREIAITLSKRGYSMTLIGLALRKDHTTIGHYLDGTRRADKYFKKRAYQALPPKTRETIIACAEKIGKTPHEVMTDWIIERAEGVHFFQAWKAA